MNRLPRIALLLALLTGSTGAGTAVAAPAQTDASGPSGSVDGRLVNDLCPVNTDEFASPTHEIQFHGVCVRFCCEQCEDKFRAKPAAYLSNLPQLSTAGVQTILDELHPPGRDDQPAGILADRTALAMLATAAVLAGWVVVRIARRSRVRRPVPPPPSPGAPAASA
jgi:YHS domain-containing protein